MLHTKLHYKETAKTAKTYSSLVTKGVTDIHKSLNELLPQRNPAMCRDSSTVTEKVKKRSYTPEIYIDRKTIMW